MSNNEYRTAEVETEHLSTSKFNIHYSTFCGSKARFLLSNCVASCSQHSCPPGPSFNLQTTDYRLPFIERSGGNGISGFAFHPDIGGATLVT